jgi:thiol-disulfide isomerase/thioredoxin
MNRFLTRVVGCLAAGLIVCGAVTTNAAAEDGSAYSPIPVIKGMKLLPEGTEAPTFNVQDVEGQDYDFSLYNKEKAHIIVFWSIFCEPCREEMPVIEQIYGEYKDKGVDVLAVNLDGEPFLASIQGFLKQYKYSFRVLLDALEGDTFKIADPYQVAGTPVLYLIDGHGQVFAGHLGRITAKDLRALIDGMLEKG